MPKIFRNIEEWQEQRNKLSLERKSIGFVATMGNLHAGHASLLQKSRQENDCRILSIFINPTQFDQASDLSNYPSTLHDDIEIACQANVDHIILPNYENLYPDDYRYKVSENDLSKRLCGENREGHFDGVLTVIIKLLNLVQADRAYFGEKDWQQFELIRGMAQAFFIPTEIVPCAIVRDNDGLALSSRNNNLSHEQRQHAPLFPQLLHSDNSIDEIRQQLTANGFSVDYIEEYNGHRFGAVRLGNMRLIDNTTGLKS